MSMPCMFSTKLPKDTEEVKAYLGKEFQDHDLGEALASQYAHFCGKHAKVRVLWPRTIERTIARQAQ
jgi:hypothetical protein